MPFGIKIDGDEADHLARTLAQLPPDASLRELANQLAPRPIAAIPAVPGSDHSTGQAEGTPTITPGSGRGFISRIGHGLAQGLETAGDIAGSAFIPGVMPMIPGTPQNQMMKERFAENRQFEQAKIGEQEAKADQEKARAEQLRERGGEPIAPIAVKPGETLVDPTSGKTVFSSPAAEKQGVEKEYVNPETGKGFYGIPTGNGVLDTATRQIISGALPYEKPEKEASKSPVAGTIKGEPVWGRFVEGKGWVDPDNGSPLSGFKPPPSFAETGLFELVPTESGGVERFNRRTGTESQIPAGGGSPPLAPGAIGSQEFQAYAVQNAGANLIRDIQANKAKFGNIEAILNSAFLGTPLADPISQMMAAEIGSFAALNPKMHGFRGKDALDEFKKLIGGLPNDPDALIGGIQGIIKTARVLTPQGAGGKEIHYKIVNGQLVKQ